MKKIAIYSAVVRDYDNVLQPVVVGDDFDYFLFSSDDLANRIGVWEVRPIPYENADPVKTARWVKTHPELLLPNYEATIWMDANIQVNSTNFYQRINEIHSDPNTIVSSVIHPSFDCVYAEMFHLVLKHYERESIVLGWGHKLRQEHYPRYCGTAETGLLYRLRCDKTAVLNEVWWNSIEQYSRRDQLSFYYALWKEGIKNRPFFVDGTTVRNNDAVNFFDHQHTSGKYIVWGKNEAWLCRYAERNPVKTKRIEDLYYWIYSTSHPHFWAKTMGLFFRVMDVFHRVLK